MGQLKRTNAKHGAGHLVGNYQESGRKQGAKGGEASQAAPGGLVGNHQDSVERGPAEARRKDALGRPDINEDKDMNIEQMKARGKGRAPAGARVAQPSHPLEAGRVDPTGRTRAGERG